jgi:hypothetical protein
VTAGVKPPPVLESCAGDEYVITVTFLDEESTAPTAAEGSVEIVLTRLNEGGATDELQLEGDLADAHALASTLEAEGDCVKFEIAQPEAEEGAAEIPETGEAPESGEEVPTSP